MRRFTILFCLSLAACGQPGPDGSTPQESAREHRSPLTLQRDAQMRRKMSAGLFGYAQLFPGTAPIDPRRFARLPPPESILAVDLPPAPKSRAVEIARIFCVYKPVMSDEEIAACR